MTVIAYQLTGSPFSVALVLIFRRVPEFIFGFVSGYVVDHYNKKKILVLCNILLGFIVLPLIWVVDKNDIWIIAVVYFSLGSVVSFFNAAVKASVPYLIEEKNRLECNSFLNSSKLMVMIFAAALGGLLMPIIGVKALIIVDSLTYFGAVIFIIALQYSKTNGEESKTDELFYQRVFAGAREVLSKKVLRKMFIYNQISAVSTCSLGIIITVYPIKLYQMGEFGVGLFNSLYGLASVIGSVLVARYIVKRKEVMQDMVFFLILLSGIFLVLMSLVTHPVLGVIFFLCSAVFYLCFYLTQENIMVEHCRKENLGRAFSFDLAAMMLLFTICNFGYGKLPSMLSVSSMGLIAGGIMIVFPLIYEGMLYVFKAPQLSPEVMDKREEI